MRSRQKVRKTTAVDTRAIYAHGWVGSGILAAIVSNLCQHASSEECQQDTERFKRCRYRTFTQNRSLYDAWMADGGQQNRRKDFYSVDRKPSSIFDLFDDVPIVLKVPTDSLHIKLGIFSKCYVEIDKLYTLIDRFRGDLFAENITGEGLRETKSTRCSSMSKCLLTTC